MTKKFFFRGFSLLIILSFVITACAPAATQPRTTTSCYLSRRRAISYTSTSPHSSPYNRRTTASSDGCTDPGRNARNCPNRRRLHGRDPQRDGHLRH